MTFEYVEASKFIHITNDNIFEICLKKIVFAECTCILVE